MKKVNVSEDKIGQFAGKWVALKGDKIVAVADELKELQGLAVGTKKHPPTATGFKVPYKGEGPYILIIKTLS